MKKSSTISLGNAQYVKADRQRYMHYQSFNKKDTIMTYIQISVACLIALIVCTGIYGIL